MLLKCVLNLASYSYAGYLSDLTFHRYIVRCNILDFALICCNIL